MRHGDQGQVSWGEDGRLYDQGILDRPTVEQEDLSTIILMTNGVVVQVM